MTMEAVKQVVGELPNMTLDQGLRMEELIRKNGVRKVLELGFCHGVSTCYMAQALAGTPDGSVTTIDLQWVKAFTPNVEDLLTRLGLRHKVTVHYEPTSYTWRLMKLIEEHPEPVFDLCYLDGAHSWFVDGLAFYLVDQLLRPGGWIVFDDLGWTYSDSETERDKPYVRAMPDDERSTAHVQKIYDLLVKRHPSYGDFRVERDWAYAHKLSGRSEGPVTVRRETVVKVIPMPVPHFMHRLNQVVRSRMSVGQGG